SSFIEALESRGAVIMIRLGISRDELQRASRIIHENGREFMIALGPWSLPREVQGRFDPKQGRLILEFRYSDDEPASKRPYIFPGDRDPRGPGHSQGPKDLDPRGHTRWGRGGSLSPAPEVGRCTRAPPRDLRPQCRDGHEP